MAFQETDVRSHFFDAARGVTVRGGGSSNRPDVDIGFPIIIFEHDDWCLTLPFRDHSFDCSHEFPVDEDGTFRTVVIYGEHPRRVLALDQNIPSSDDNGRPLPSNIRDIIHEGAPLHYYGTSDFPGVTEIYLGETLHASN